MMATINQSANILSRKLEQRLKTKQNESLQETATRAMLESFVQSKDAKHQKDGTLHFHSATDS